MSFTDDPAVSVPVEWISKIEKKLDNINYRLIAEQEKLDCLLSLELTYNQAAHVLGISRSTLHNRREQYPDHPFYHKDLKNSSVAPRYYVIYKDLLAWQDKYFPTKN